MAWGLGRGFHRYQGADSAPVGIGTSFGVGWYLRPRLALAWRFGVLAMAGVDVDRVTEMHYTGAAQYWLADKVWLGAAVGVGGIGNDDRGEDQIVWGPALEGRAGWVVNDSKHSVALILGATAAMVEDERLLGVVMHIGYQLQ